MRGGGCCEVNNGRGTGTEDSLEVGGSAPVEEAMLAIVCRRRGALGLVVDTLLIDCEGRPYEPEGSDSEGIVESLPLHRCGCPPLPSFIRDGCFGSIRDSAHELLAEGALTIGYCRLTPPSIVLYCANDGVMGLEADRGRSLE